MEVVGSSKIIDSISSNVLQFLQSAVHLKRLKKQSEIVFVLAAQRVAGLKLIATLMSKKMPHSFDLINWFCSALRGNTNHLCHYLDDIRGCGLSLERQARDNFFLIIEGLLHKLQKSKEETEVRQILNSLRWDYNSTDHAVLERLGIFRMLRDGDSSSEKLTRLWGSKFKYEFIFKESTAAGTVKTKDQDRKEDFALLNKIELSREVIDIFENVLVGGMGKSFQSLEHNSSNNTIKLKDNGKKGMMLPNLEKFQSVLSVESTLKLLGQAFEILFRELQAFVDFAQKFDGISWKVFVRLMNRYRKTGTYIKPDNVFIPPEEQAVRAGRGSPTVVDEAPDYGHENEYDQEEYEGGEIDPIDPEAEIAHQDRLKEEIELTKF